MRTQCTSVKNRTVRTQSKDREDVRLVLAAPQLHAEICTVGIRIDVDGSELSYGAESTTASRGFEYEG